VILRSHAVSTGLHRPLQSRNRGEFVSNSWCCFGVCYPNGSQSIPKGILVSPDNVLQKRNGQGKLNAANISKPALGPMLYLRPSILRDYGIGSLPMCAKSGTKPNCQATGDHGNRTRSTQVNRISNNTKLRTHNSNIVTIIHST
jgi:hypothetical protein